MDGAFKMIEVIRPQSKFSLTILPVGLLGELYVKILELR